MQIIFKQLPLILISASVLSACITVNTPVPVAPTSPSTHTGTASSPQVGYKLAPSHWSDVAKIRQEAERLGAEVNANKITKIQAAQYLNRYRLNLVGANQIDDAVYQVYQKAALDSHRGLISPEQSKLQVKNELALWKQRWNTMSVKPANPAFTNFLMEYMDIEPLQ